MVGVLAIGKAEKSQHAGRASELVWLNNTNPTQSPTALPHQLTSLCSSTPAPSLVISVSTMPISAEPNAILSHLHRADGSATFSQNGYTVIGAVNGPMEVSRRDELPESAYVEVMVRPAAGVGGEYSCPSFS